MQIILCTERSDAFAYYATQVAYRTTPHIYAHGTRTSACAQSGGVSLLADVLPSSLQRIEEANWKQSVYRMRSVLTGSMIDTSVTRCSNGPKGNNDIVATRFGDDDASVFSRREIPGGALAQAAFCGTSCCTSTQSGGVF